MMNSRIPLGAGLCATLLLGSLGLVQAQDYPQRTHDHRAREICRDVRVRNRPTDNHRIAGTAIGAVAGGLLGHQVGGGRGKTLATVGGAVAGGYVGNRVQKNHQDTHASYHVERRCRPAGR